jgi:hypothetical protein
MATIYDARSVNPNDVTDAQLAEVFAEHGITQVDEIADFFKPGTTYRRGPETFRCAIVGTDGLNSRAALGYMPVTLRGVHTWEVMFQTAYDWSRGWTEVAPEPEPVPSCGNCRRAFDPADRSFDGAAEDRSMPGFCRGCVDNCHEADAGHRCTVCKSLTEQSGR